VAVREQEHDDPGRLPGSRDAAQGSALALELQQALGRQLRDALAERGHIELELPPTEGRPIGAGRSTVAGSDERAQALLARLAKPETAAAITAASFLPWLSCPDRLRLAGLNGFRELHFDARCPTGIRGTPPVIDFMASGSSGVVGAALQTFDYLGRRTRRGVTNAYATLQLPPGLRPWAAFLGGQGREPGRFHHVDAAGLAKLALGLGQIFSGQPIRLLYLFLEPRNPGALPCFARHRAELARLATATADATVGLVAMSLHELWSSWQAEDLPPPLRGIVAELIRRYDVAIPGPTRLS
jgi:hypothetical protein